MTGHGQPQAGNNVGPAQISERELRENFFPPFREVVAPHRHRRGDAVLQRDRRRAVPRQQVADRRRAARRMGVRRRRRQRLQRGRGARDAAPRRAGPPRRGRVCALARASTANCPTAPPSARWPTLVRARRGAASAAIDAAVRAHARAQVPRRAVRESLCAMSRGRRGSPATPRRARWRCEAARRSICLLKNDGMLPLDGRRAQARRGHRPQRRDRAAGRLLERAAAQSVSLLDGVKREARRQAEVVHAQGVFITQSEDRSADDGAARRPGAEPRADRRSGRGGARRRRHHARDRRHRADQPRGLRHEPSRRPHRASTSSASRTSCSTRCTRSASRSSSSRSTAARRAGPMSSPRRQCDPRMLVRRPGRRHRDGRGAVRRRQSGRASCRSPWCATSGRCPIFYNHKPSAAARLSVRQRPRRSSRSASASATPASRSARRGCRRRDRGATAASPSRSTSRNTGARAGDEVVQLYVRDRDRLGHAAGEGAEGLRARHAAPGERRTVRFTLGPEAFRCGTST